MENSVSYRVYGVELFNCRGKDTVAADVTLVHILHHHNIRVYNLDKDRLLECRNTMYSSSFSLIPGPYDHFFFQSSY